jgi:hypothetical protein
MSDQGATNYHRQSRIDRAHDLGRLRVIVRWGWYIRTRKEPRAAAALLGLDADMAQRAVEISLKYGDERGRVMASKVVPEIHAAEELVWDFCDRYAVDWMKGGVMFYEC